MSTASSSGTGLPARPRAGQKARATTIRPMRFAVTFAVCFLLGIGVLLTPPVQIADNQFSRALVKVAKGVVVTCGGKALVQGAVLRDPVGGFAVEMRDGCNAVNVTILLWSAVLAFPAPWRMKMLGLAAGSVLIQVLNIARFISLYYIGQYSMSWFDFAHGYLWETLLVLDTMVIFWLWVNRVLGSASAPNEAR
jgi:exosortase H (IPTLxxWG-CTERM-specific)